MPNDFNVRYAIVGAGTAGIAAAEAIREVDSAGDLLVLNGEKFPPYCRPLIIEVLTGERTFDQVKQKHFELWEIQGDKPGTLWDMYKDMKQAGFQSVDCIWMNYNLGVLVATNI